MARHWVDMKLNLHGKLEMIGFLYILLPLLSIVSLENSPNQSLKGGSTKSRPLCYIMFFVGPLKVHEFLHVYHVSVLRELHYWGSISWLNSSASKHLLFVASNYQAKFEKVWNLFLGEKSVAYQPTTQAQCFFGAKITGHISLPYYLHILLYPPNI